MIPHVKIPILKKREIFTLLFCAIIVVNISFTKIHESILAHDGNFSELLKSYLFDYEPRQEINEIVYQKPEVGESINVPVIVYHSIRPSYPEESASIKQFTTEPVIFEQELLFLQERGYATISFDDVLAYFDKGKPLPKKSVILTFDDGWENQYNYAFPLLKKYSMTGTFFIFTNAIGHKNFMSWDQIKELDKAGMTIGGHSKTHPYLTKITDPEKLAVEISNSKNTIEEHIGKPITAFAYPFGLYNEQTIEAVRSAGYRIARTSKAGITHTADSLLTFTCLYDQNAMYVFERFEKTIELQSIATSTKS